MQSSNLRSILVRTTSCQVHPATCTRLWKAFFGIAWVLYQLGSLHNARKSTSAMSNFEKKSQKTSITTLQKQSLKTTKNPNQSLNPHQSIHSYYKQKKSLQILGWICKKSNRYLNKKKILFLSIAPISLFILLTYYSISQFFKNVFMIVIKI